MARYSRFTFLCDVNERQAIVILAAQLQRSQSDAVRFLVTETARKLSQAVPVRAAPPPVKVQKIKQGQKCTSNHRPFSEDKE